MEKNYILKCFSDNPTYIRDSSLKELREVDVVVFDCDGVLLDIRESYCRSVARTTTVIIEAFTGTRIEESFFDADLNFAYKQTGGFNNDWALTYTLIMKLLADLSSKELDMINEVADRSLRYETPFERFQYIQEHRPEVSIHVEGVKERLHDFAMSLDSTGVKAVDERLFSKLGPVKRALNFPGDVGESMVSTLFEETLGGTQLFQETFGQSATFNQGDTGFIENERVVVSEETLEKLSVLLGGNRMGIASGSLANTARHALGDILNKFRSDAQVWHDDVAKAVKATGRSDLHKPNPYALLRALEPFKPYKRVLYVGDTSADYMTSTRAGVLFAGVYGSVSASERTKDAFIELGCSVVAPTVNDLPDVLRTARESN
ncbi:MAG: hypothetical protein NWE89_10900 [Candidatus Bathyarchaeota archaeon]|nr:hypothetical protein [Candidatus Bathyarchaeota archaeon]